jgi:ABC-type multidrug transport system ATPase subunit
VIVDEPTVGLDPEERVRFRNLLSEIAQRRVVILSTHIVSDVEAVASRIAVIRSGRLVTEATPESLLRAAEGRVFSAVVAGERLAEVQRMNGVHVSNLIRRADGVHVRYVTNGGGAVATLPAASKVEPNLEDAYLMTSLDAAAAAGGARPA